MGRSPGALAVAVAVLVLLSVVAGVGPRPASVGAAPSSLGLAPSYEVGLLPGVQYRQMVAPAPALRADVAHVAPGAPVRLEVLLAHDGLAPVDPAARREVTSDACRRAGAIVCVNADFDACPTCGFPFGGVARHGVLDRSPIPAHEQLVLLDGGGMAAGVLDWTGSLDATLEWDEPVGDDDDGGGGSGGDGGGGSDGGLGDLLDPLLGGGTGDAGGDGGASDPAPEPPDGGATPTVRTERHSLALDAVNRSRGPDEVVLYTSVWSERTGTAPGGSEALVSLGSAVRLGADVPVGLLELRADGADTPIVAGDGVLSAEGAGSDRLHRFWQEVRGSGADRVSVALRVRTALPVSSTVGGHPVVLRDGQEVLDRSDPVVVARHPRTLVGWNAAGDLWLVTVDGRRPGHSVGVDLAQAAQLLRDLGATDAFNLDGGGSSTFVAYAPCPGIAPCLQNRPSDGRERPVVAMLALVPDDPSMVAAPEPAPPPTEPSPPPPPPPTEPPPPPPPPPPPTGPEPEPEAEPEEAPPALPEAPIEAQPSDPSLLVPPAGVERAAMVIHDADGGGAPWAHHVATGAAALLVAGTWRGWLAVLAGRSRSRPT